MFSYKKLSEVKKDDRANVIVILKYFSKAPGRTTKGTFVHAKIVVSDESILPKDFKISVFSRLDNIPEFPRNTLLRFIGVKIEEYKKMLDGRIFDLSQLSIINPFNAAAMHKVDPGTKQRVGDLIAAFPNLFCKTALAPQNNPLISKLQFLAVDTPFKLSQVKENSVQDLIGVIDELWDYKMNPETKMWDNFSIQLTDNSIYPSTIRVFVKCCYETMPSLSMYSVLYLRNVIVEKVNWRIIGRIEKGEDVWDLNMKCGGPLSDLDTTKLSIVQNAEAATARIHNLIKWSQLNYGNTEEIERLSEIYGISWEPLA